VVGSGSASPARSVEPGHVPGGEDDQDGVAQPAGGEQQRLGRRPVQPVRVVDEAEQRTVGRGGGQQREGGRADGVPGRRLPRVTRWVAGGGRRRQRRGMTGGQLREEPEQRPDQLGERREREPRLELDAHRAYDRAAVGAVREVVEQRGLADAGLPAQHQAAAAPTPGVGQQGRQPEAFGLPPDKLHSGTIGSRCPGDAGIDCCGPEGKAFVLCGHFHLTRVSTTVDGGVTARGQR
jgi:hypothetical protein